MKLLFDQNLSPRLPDRLADLYPGSAHVAGLGLDRAQDAEVWELAREQDFLIVTKDTDFNEMSLLVGFPPKVIWIRRGNCSTAEIELILRREHPLVEALTDTHTSESFFSTEGRLNPLPLHHLSLPILQPPLIPIR